jgi:predicted RNA binding protein YcfA (HicA-like mRNA interferase family)
MRPRRLLDRLRRGALDNVRFTDFLRLVEAAGFRPVRQRGSHHAYRHETWPAILTLQDVRGYAKPYQIRQFLRTMDEYGLDLEAPDD